MTIPASVSGVEVTRVLSAPKEPPRGNKSVTVFRVQKETDHVEDKNVYGTASVFFFVLDLDGVFFTIERKLADIDGNRHFIVLRHQHLTCKEGKANGPSLVLQHKAPPMRLVSPN